MKLNMSKVRRSVIDQEILNLQKPKKELKDLEVNFDDCLDSIEEI